MQEALLAELEVNHKCWCVELTEKFRDTTLTGIPTHAENPGSIAHTFIVKTDQAERVIEFIKKHPMATCIKPIKKSKDSMIIYVEQPRDTLFVNAAAQYGAILTDPTLTANGQDTVSLFFNEEKNVKKLFSDLGEDFDIKLKSKRIVPLENLSFETFHTSGFFKLQGASSLLSQRQREVFALASRRGYFRIPKKVTIEELAQEIGLDGRTTADHLRKAQSKLLPLMTDLMKIS